jgi:oleate hydratase
MLARFTKNKSEREGIFTITDSNWLLSMAMPHQPHFADQPKNYSVFWGYGLSPARVGNFTKKKMADCSGSEILAELCGHLGTKKELSSLRKNSTCIPCLLPHITSQFFPRKKGDRPAVIPKNFRHFACIGQYCEIAEGIVFTVENSVLSAQIAVDGLLHLRKKPTPIFHGQYHPKIICRAIRTAFR